MAEREVNQIGRALRRLRREAGSPSYREIERAIVKTLGIYAPGAETIRLYHMGQVRPDRCDLLLIVALADYYEVGISEISPVMVDRFKSAKELMERQSAWIYTEAAA